MCLLTTQQEVKIAQEDITCYKVINPDMTSLHYTEFKWELGKLYEVEMEFCPKGLINTVSQAFHSYKTLMDMKYEYVMSSKPCMMVKCTIPKGSEYCSGKQGDVDGHASNKLIVNEVLDVKDVFTLFDWDHYPYKVGQIIKSDRGDTLQILNIQPIINNLCRADIIVKICGTSTYGAIKTVYKKGTWGGANVKLEILKD